MASIPLPALSIKAPEQPDIMQQYGALLQLHNAAQNAPLQRQILQQQAQTGQMQMQQDQQAQKDQQAFRAAMADPSMQGKTIGEVADTLAHQGALSPTTYQALKKADIEHRKSLAEVDEKTLANMKAAHDQTQQLYSNVMNMPDDQLQANWAQIAQQYDSIPGNQKMPLDPNKPLPKQQLAQFAPFISMGNAYFDEEMNRRKQKAGTVTAEADAQTKQIALTAQQLAASPDQASYQTALGELPMKVAKLFPAQFDKDAVLQAGMSPDQQAMARNPTEASLAAKAAKGDPQAKAALDLLAKQKAAGRTSISMAGPNNAKDIAQAIISGQQQPTLEGLGRGDTGLVRGELARNGYNLMAATSDWKAVQKHIASLNGPQQLRLSQSIGAMPDMLDKVDSLYSEWKQLAPQSGFKVINKATLAAMKNLPGRPGAVAQALDAQIADVTADLGNIYMGGNSPTDHALDLAAKNFQSNWNDDTFQEGLKQARANVKIRQNSIANSQAQGLSGTTNYAPAPQPQQPASVPDGTVKTNSHGDKIVKRGGQWQLAQ